MDHADAVGNQAVERYLLGEMPGAEAEVFERHFFECGDCAQELESGVLLAENMRAALAESSVAQQPVAVAAPKAVRGNWEWLKGLWRLPSFAVPALAAAALAGVVVYQAGELAQANKPRVLLAYAIKSATRGEPDRISVKAGQASLVIAPDDLPEVPSRTYRWDLYDSSGRTRFSLDSAAPPRGTAAQILIPARDLQPGPYSLAVRGMEGSSPGSEIARYTFVLEIQ